MNTEYQNQIVLIKYLLADFYKKKFSNDHEEYLANKENKKQIEQLIIKAKEDDALSNIEKKHVIKECLNILAKNTGSAEDTEIAESILDHLFYNLNFLSQADIDHYYKFVSTNRWD